MGDYIMEEKITESILIQAEKLVNGARQEDYDDPIKNWELTAKIASLLTGINLSSTDCLKIMQAVKLAREAYKHKEDNNVDLCGYTEILNRVEKHNSNPPHDAYSCTAEGTHNNEKGSGKATV
jgi:hypothetical protein